VNNGDKIVVQGIQKVIDGCTIVPLPATAPAVPSSAGSATEGKGKVKQVPAAKS